MSKKGVNVKKLRKLLRMTAQEFAELIGVHVVTVSRWENGHTEPSEMAARRIRELMAKKGVL